MGSLQTWTRGHNDVRWPRQCDVGACGWSDDRSYPKQGVCDWSTGRDSAKAVASIRCWTRWLWLGSWTSCRVRIPQGLRCRHHNPDQPYDACAPLLPAPFTHNSFAATVSGPTFVRASMADFCTAAHMSSAPHCRASFVMTASTCPPTRYFLSLTAIHLPYSLAVR